jgi:flagellar biosynthesis chaperone FliJ
MSPTYAQNKVHIYKWREKQENYHKQLISNNITSKKYQKWKQIQKVFFNILL